MATTPNWSIVYPVVGTTMTPLANHFANVANSTDTALNNIRANTAYTVNSSAQRDAIFTSPSQGNRVYRADKGWEEAYFELYNPSTNPGGANPAGWYPVSGMTPKFLSVASVNTTVANNTWVTLNQNFGSSDFNNGFSNSSGTITVPYAGVYECSALVTFPGSSAGNIRALRWICSSSHNWQDILRTTAWGASGITRSSSATLNVRAGETIKLDALHDIGSSQSLITDKVSIRFISPGRA